MLSLFLIVILPVLLIAYLSSRMMGCALFTYGRKKILETGNPLYSAHARIEKHVNESPFEINRLRENHQEKKDRILYKRIKKQQALHNANTKVHIRFLATSTKKQLKLLRKKFSSKQLAQYRREIKQCVSNQDMDTLLNINLMLIDAVKSH